MPRPRKCRKVCCLSNKDGFVPVRGGEELTPIVLNVDEYESIRLIDREGFFRSNAENICVLPEQRFSRFMQLPAKNWPMRWLRTSSANRGRGFYTLQRKQRSLRVQKLLSTKNPSDARKTKRK